MTRRAVLQPIRKLIAPIAVVLLAGCGGEKERPLFKLLAPNQTGVTFANTITTDDSLNYQTDTYVYNGAGVGIGDIDNDGLPDIFFAGNMVSSRLYLNKGRMRFEDITRRARVGTNRWATGVTMVDIDNDGYLDIYLSVSGPEWSKAEDRANLLFINNRDRTFTESAARYGIADTGFTAHAAFLDYDGDGCLDLFLLNNSPKDFFRGVASHPTGGRRQTTGSYNQLYRNDCHGRFANVSKEAGLLLDPGYGLGVAVADVNRDGRPDIYVSNDGLPNDVLYVNTGGGAFTNKAARWLKHTSSAGMGVDIADFNNDGWPDILQLDMLPRDLSRRKRMSGFATYKSFLELHRWGFRDDYTANSLQLSNGTTKDGDIIFSDVAHLAGVAATDWSWSPLFADFDNDGYKDIFISNGYPKAVNDQDYQTAMGPLRGRRDAASRRMRVELLRRLPGYDEPNYVFRNNGNLTFSDKTNQWLIERPSYSYGSAYADLDNDGRLDLVVNNIDAPAFIYQNVQPKGPYHYLAIELEGDAPNKRGIGAELILSAGGQKQYIYQSPFRGYMSTVDDRAHFGLGRLERVDSLEVIWPDRRHQLLTDLDVDRLLVVKQSDAAVKARTDYHSIRNPVFQPLDSRGRPAYKHQGRNLTQTDQAVMLADYSVQPLLPYMLSTHGPPLAVADVNGDGLDDVFIGSGPGVPGQLFVQQKDGSFVGLSRGQPWESDKGYDDWGATFFDANGDGRPDLYVTSGGYQLTPSSPLLQDRLYVNEGGGKFKRDVEALPTMLASKATVRAGDFNGDGRQDLFVGGRMTPREYPYPARSYLLRNDGGRFTDVTEEVAPELVHPGGMITDAVWVDFDGDGRLDLVTAGEWMPIQFYRNDGKRLRNVTQSTHLPPMRGWWYSLAVGDFDEDGRPDIVAGNLGLNYTYTTSKDSRLGVYANSFTGNSTTDIVLTQNIGGTEYPLAGFAPLGQQIYLLTVRFPTYGSFARASIPQLFSAAQLQRSVHYEADTFASVYLHNEGGGMFSSSTLPNLAQIAPIKGIIAHDVDGDGHLDLVVAGNLYDTEPNTPRADAGNGLWLRGDGHGRFVPVPPGESGFVAPLNVNGLTLVSTPRGQVVLVANSGDSLQAFRLRRR